MRRAGFGGMHFPHNPTKRKMHSGYNRLNGQKMKTFVTMMAILTLTSGVTVPADGSLPPSTDLAEQIITATTEALLQKTSVYIKDPMASVHQVTVTPPSVETLPPCKHLPDIIIPGQNRLLVGNITIKAVCQEPRWSIRVKANVRIELPIIKSARTIGRNQIIQTDDLTIQQVSLNRIRGRYFTDKHEITGQMASRRISPARIIRPDMIEQPAVIKKHDNVIIEARNNGITVTMAGQALESGAINESIQVRNNSSGKVVKARILGSGRVETVIP